MITLAQFWATVIALALIVYIVLDGFDLGVGMLLGLAKDESRRQTVLKTIEPVWDGNETWLIVLGATLYAAFPMAYAIYMPALYVGIVMLLLALILRGVGIEFRYRSVANRRWWDRAIVAGSFTAGFVQGVAMGAITQGIHVENGQFVGGSFDWLSVFSVMCGIAAVVSYLVHGMAWLILKTEGVTRERAYRHLPFVFAGWVLFLAVLFWWVLIGHVDLRERWAEPSGLWVLPVVGVLACVGLFVGVRRRIDRLPFAMTTLMFLVVAGKFMLSIRPYIVPWTVTVSEAAAPQESLSFLFFGGVVIIPVMLIYTAAIYWIFRGKVATD